MYTHLFALNFGRDGAIIQIMLIVNLENNIIYFAMYARNSKICTSRPKSAMWPDVICILIFLYSNFQGMEKLYIKCLHWIQRIMSYVFCHVCQKFKNLYFTPEIGYVTRYDMCTHLFTLNFGGDGAVIHIMLTVNSKNNVIRILPYMLEILKSALYAWNRLCDQIWYVYSSICTQFFGDEEGIHIILMETWEINIICILPYSPNILKSALHAWNRLHDQMWYVYSSICTQFWRGWSTHTYYAYNTFRQ